MRQLEDETLRAVAKLAANSNDIIAHALNTVTALATGQPDSDQLVVRLAVMMLERTKMVSALHDRFTVEGTGFGDWIKEETT